jgi:hypothetical protein
VRVTVRARGISPSLLLPWPELFDQPQDAEADQVHRDDNPWDAHEVIDVGPPHGWTPFLLQQFLDSDTEGLDAIVNDADLHAAALKLAAVSEAPNRRWHSCGHNRRSVDGNSPLT